MTQASASAHDTYGHAPSIGDAAYQARLDKIAADPRMSDDNIRLPKESADKAGRVMLVLGVVGVIAVALGFFAFGTLRYALSAYFVGATSVLAMCLGCLFMTLVFHAMNVGWSVTIRRIMEQAASLVWVPVLMLLPVVLIELFSGGILFTWMGINPEENFLMSIKAPYLNEAFFFVRFALYGVIWWFMASRLRGWSLQQDAGGNRWLTSKMRRFSCGGLLVFALTTAFAAFDLLMSMDYRFFSTMWGVYYFAASAFAGVTFTAVVLVWLRLGGRLAGLVTPEHFHDLGKLVFAFTVFWAYIAFSQYFLIWYSNIPEETWYYIFRRENFMPLTVFLVVGHFAIPFLLLISRIPKKIPLVFGLISAFALFMHFVDLTWVIRPMADAGQVEVQGGTLWLDILGPMAALGFFGFLFFKQLSQEPLIPTKDPRLPEALSHKNYV